MDICVFTDISLQLSMLLWISIWISLDFYGYPYIELLWILDPGAASPSPSSSVRYKELDKGRTQEWKIKDLTLSVSLETKSV